MIANKEITNTENILDTRDILERIEYLQDDPDETEVDELAALEALIQEVTQVSGDAPEDGATLIRDSYFAEYAEELAYDQELISPTIRWPINYIDWEAAAEALKQDYYPVDFDHITYWVRS
jgi:hypothetical protein